MEFRISINTSIGLFAKRTLILLSTIIPSNKLVATPLQLDSKFTSQSTDNFTGFYLEQENLQADDFRTAAISARLELKSRAYFGVSSTPLWGSFELENISGKTQSFIYEIPNVFIDSIQLYTQNPDGRFSLLYSTGDRQIFATRAISAPTFAFPLTLESGQKQRYLIRLKTEGSLVANARLWSRSEFYSDLQIRWIVFAAFYACFISLLLYNIALALMTKEMAYSSYCLYLVASIFFYLTWNGLAPYLLWPNSPEWSNKALLVSLNQVTVWASIFAFYYIDANALRSRGRFYYYQAPFIRITIALGFVQLGLIFFIPYRLGLQLVYGYVIAIVGYVLLVGGKYFHDRIRATYFFGLAWITLLISTLIAAASFVGLIQMTALANYSLQIGAVLEIILLSIGLGDRYNEARKGRFEALQKLRSKLEILFNTTQAMAQKTSTAEVGEHLFATIVTQIPGLSQANFRILVRSRERTMLCWEFQLIDSVMQSKLNLAADFATLIEKTKGEPQWTDAEGLTHAFRTELRGLCFMNIESKLVEQQNEEDIGLISALVSVLAITLDNIFYTEDLKYLVEERTSALHLALERATEEKLKSDFLLDNSQIGILTFAEDLIVEQDFSAYLSQILRIPKQMIQGEEIVNLVAKESEISNDSKDRLRQALKFSFHENLLTWELNEEHFLNQIKLSFAEEKRTLALDWRPIIDESGLIRKVMLCLRDITRQIEIEAVLEKAHAKHDRIAKIFGQMIRHSPTHIERGLADMERRMQIVQQSLYATHQGHNLMIELHTLKGNARILDFSLLTEAIHNAESLHQSSDFQAVQLSLAAEKIQAILNEYRGLFLELFKVQGVERELATERSFSLTLLSVVSEAFAPAAEHLSSSGFITEQINCQDKFAQWSQQSLKLIRDILIHTFNNIADHGYVLPAKSLKEQSRQAVRIDICAEVIEDEVCLRIQDNGYGINFEKLQSVARKRGLISADADPNLLLSLLLKGGLSSAEQVSTRSGRGVGLSAIAALAAELSGSVKIEAGVVEGTVLLVRFPVHMVSRKPEVRRNAS